MDTLPGKINKSGKDASCRNYGVFPRLQSSHPHVAVAVLQSLPKADSNERGHWLRRTRLSTKIDASEFEDSIDIMQCYCMVLINGGILRVKYYLAITPR
jgi:hypothetical protein